MQPNNKPNPPSNVGQNTLEIQKIEATVDSAYYFRKKPIYSFVKRFFDIFLSPASRLPPPPAARRPGRTMVAGPDGPFEGDYNIRRMSKRCISAV